MPKFIATEGGVPVGTYDVVLDRFEDYDDNAKAYGDGLRVVFKITRGKHKNEEASRIFSKRFGKKANLRKFGETLARRALETGEEFDFSPFAGLPGKVVVEETDSGATRVETFLPDFDAWEDDVEDEIDDEVELEEDEEEEEEPPRPRKRKPVKRTSSKKAKPRRK